MTKSQWKKTMSIPNRKTAWEHKNGFDEVFVTPRGQYQDGEWMIGYPGKSKEHGLDLLMSKTVKNRQSAFAFARKFMRQR